MEPDPIESYILFHSPVLIVWGRQEFEFILYWLGWVVSAMNDHLWKWNLPVILAAGINTPALDGSSKTIVKVTKFISKVSDNDQVH